jgi:hypothetical protein
MRIRAETREEARKIYAEEVPEHDFVLIQQEEKK